MNRIEPRALFSLIALGLLAAVSTVGCEPSGEEAGEETGSVSGAASVETLPGRFTASCREAIQARPNSRIRDWRDAGIKSGPIVLGGAQLGFAKRPLRGGLVKVPLLLGGDERVSISIDPRDRSRAEIRYVGTAWTKRLLAEGCGDGQVTFWAGGLRLSDASKPVALEVQVDGEPDVRTVILGRGKR